MKKRIFLIGNGFDISHGMPTKFDPDFKFIAEKNESIYYFWDIYNAEGKEIWSDFENLLANPDFNSLEEIFEGFQPDYASDRESDRDSIITQVDLNGNLQVSLNEFAEQAEKSLDSIEAQKSFVQEFQNSDKFITFNYTHTLEKIYGISEENILHVHGEVGQKNLILGYPKGQFEPEKYCYDIRRKGRGPYREVDIRKYIEDMARNEVIDCYTYTAYSNFIGKIEGFNKKYQIPLMEKFLDKQVVDEIIVIGHSCAIDFAYFEHLNASYQNIKWVFHAFDSTTKNNILNLVKDVGITNFEIYRAVRR